MRHYIARRLRADYPRGVVAVYDNGGRTCDRYTVVYAPTVHDGRWWWQYVGMSGAPFHPQGFCQHGETCGMRPGTGGRGWGNACGRVITWAALPRDCQRAVRQNLREEVS